MIKQASTRTNQGGSILIFTIVAVILAAALVGSVLFIRHKGEVAQTRVPIMGPVTPPTETSKDGATGDKKGEEGANNTPSQAENKNAANPTPQGSSATNDSSVGAPSSATELPKTGPADVAGSMLVVGLVTMVLVSYVRSRHLSWQL